MDVVLNPPTVVFRCHVLPSFPPSTLVQFVGTNGSVSNPCTKGNAAEIPTVIVVVAVDVHPFAAVPVTVYVVEEDGEAETFAPVEGVSPAIGSHEYVTAPDALNGVAPDGQISIELGVTATVRVGLTVTAIVWSELQLPLEPVTVYVIVEVGLAVTALPVVALNPVAGAHE